MRDNGMVIVGAGEAGARAAVELRTQGWKGGITIIGDENRYPYERPPLSKQQLSGEEAPQPVTIVDEARLRELDIQLLAGDKAVRIDREGHAVELASGARVSYAKLLLATGASPRRLAANGDGAQEMLYLRTFADALRLRTHLKPGNRIAVIGGGFIGLEVAASAVALGCEVTLVEIAARILMRGVPAEIASMVEERHRAAGVRFKTGVLIDRVEKEGEELVLKLADGTAIRCDAIVTGIGAIPAATLAEECGLDIENGVKVDAALATSDPDIYAAGDCCSFPHPLYGGRRIRLEAWRNAQDQGTHAAGNMLGAGLPYEALPWFWSDQYDQTLQVAGLSDGADTTVTRDLGEAGKLFFHIAGDGSVAAVSGMGPAGAFAKEFRLAEMLIERRARPEPAALSDPGRKLKELLRA
jgi:3-phenylpropionate/trans-cinnamate dioxygenase ferredoxin reductase subunit